MLKSRNKHNRVDALSRKGKSRDEKKLVLLNCSGAASSVMAFD
jgi:hypothetical protein